MAIERGISAIALTDHNTTAGLYEFMRAAEGKPIEAICGVEFSTDFGERELHIVALYVDPTHFGEIEALVTEMKKRKDNAYRVLIERLTALGMDISYESASEGARGLLSRAHIAYELYKKGYADSVSDAFERYLDPKNGIYLPPRKLDVFETIKFIRKIGAVPVLAHPYTSLKCVESIESFLALAKDSGLVAIETEYTTHDLKMTGVLRSLAEKYSLLESGGSDFHGTKKPNVSLGTGYGALRVPYELERRLRAFNNLSRR